MSKLLEELESIIYDMTSHEACVIDAVSQRVLLYTKIELEGDSINCIGSITENKRKSLLELHQAQIHAALTCKMALLAIVASSKIAPFLEKALPIVISLMTPPTGWIKAGIKLVRLLFEAKLGNWSGSHSA